MRVNIDIYLIINIMYWAALKSAGIPLMFYSVCLDLAIFRFALKNQYATPGPIIKYSHNEPMGTHVMNLI